MANNAATNYPDLSQPVNSGYPDLSSPRIMEDFSNPTEQEGFNKLSPEEKIERIELSQFAPEHFDAIGEGLPPGVYPHTRQFLTGATQALANTPIELANILKKQPMQKFNFAGESVPAQAGQVAGDIGTFFIPGAAVGEGVNLLSKIPKIGQGVNALTKGIENSKILKNITNIARTAGETGIFAARKNPEQAGESFGEGSLTGGALQTGLNLATSGNPVINTLAKLGIGAGIGSTYGHPYYGAVTALAAPQLFKAVGGQNAVAQDVLSGLEQKDILRSKAAADRLGTTITPAQAAGNPVTAATEGAYKRTPEGAQYAFRQEQLQNRQQAQAINRMLDKIYRPTPQSENAISAAYKKAEDPINDIAQNEIDNWKQDPIVKDAFDSVKRSPAFRNASENNYKFLSEVNRTLRRQANGLKFTEPNKSFEISQAQMGFDRFLKDNNTDYEQAAKLAQPKIVRRNIEDRFNRLDEDYTGKNFYSRFMSKRQAYKDLLQDTANFPEAQKDIKDMRQAWKHLSNMKTVSQGEAQAKIGLDQARDVGKAIMEAIKRLSGIHGDVKALKFIYSKDWDKGFARIMKTQDRKERNRQLLTFFGKIAGAYGLMP